MEAIIDKAVADGNKIDAILAENDSTALGVVGALTAKSYGFPPLSGQDGDPANLNNVALGKQYVDVLKNANELGKTAGAAALELCADAKTLAGLTLPDGLVDPTVAPDRRAHRPRTFTTPGGDVGQVVHPPADPAHRGEPPGGDRCRPDHEGRPLQGRRRGARRRPPASSGHRPLT